jgi:hypothetical protein
MAASIATMGLGARGTAEEKSVYVDDGLSRFA